MHLEPVKITEYFTVALVMCQSLPSWQKELGYDFGSVGLCVCLFVSNITRNEWIAMTFYG